MKIKDVIYGEFEISEPVILELMKCKSVMRLKGVSQQGVKENSKWGVFSRYEHSIGVMLLLRMFNCNLKEQIAGILHDVSHTAFSHLIDWVIGDPMKDNYQDDNHEEIIMNSEIPFILEKYGINAKDILEYENFPILEREAPSLCADRVDYTLRDLFYNKDVYGYSKDFIIKFVGELSLYNNEIVFNSKKTAKEFGEVYAKCQREHWAGAEPTVRQKIFADALKLAMEEGILKEEDFFKDDEYVMRILRKSKNNKIKKVLYLINKDFKIDIVEKNPQYFLKRKFRYIDPRYLENGSVRILSENDLGYKTFLEEQRGINEAGLKINVLE